MVSGWRTIPQGGKAFVINRMGVARLVEGPQQIFLWRAKEFRILDRFAAWQTEYLRISYKNGLIEHRPGPCVEFLHPLEIVSIEVKPAVVLDANEVLVVYRKVESGKVERRLQHGPTQFVPSAEDWVHEFSWHGTDPANKTRLIPNTWKFTKLKVVPDQFYYNVDEVRTLDDALVKVKLMLFYEINSIDLMLQQTRDPIADMANGLTADVVAFASQLTYEEFLEKTGQLNVLDSYPQLLARAKSIGYHINKVVYRGYQAPQQLQQMHDDANRTRTQLRLSVEQEEQQQDVTDMKLGAELQSMKMEHELKIQQVEHSRTLDLDEVNHEIALEDRKREEKMKQMVAEKNLQLQAKKEAGEQLVNYLSQLKRMGVDLNQYLASQNPKPAKVTRIMSAGESTIPVHIHSS
ncbi:uncharacterized protein [Oscarella lobularis]|uniref:uncharacterized protein n=1 Tax=Oscarella lobularis TaxID=121494 RepID=UPI003313DDB7